MVFGRKKSVNNGNLSDFRKSVKISKEDQNKLKVRTINVHDPILNAVNEEQPFQDANNAHGHKSQKSLSYMAMSSSMKDTFGNPIRTPDISNPTRDRNERPMDTIRSFEYNITKDPLYIQQLETPVYGWATRPDFEFTVPTTNMRATNRDYEQAVYQPPVRATSGAQKKKKRGLFGRKR